MEWRFVAESQHGVITTAQATACGLTRARVRWKVESGRWQRLGRGLYLTHTGAATWLVRAQAAVLRGGLGSLLTGRSSAYLHDLAPRPPSRITVAVSRERRVVPLPGMSVERRNGLPVVIRRGLPVLSPAWTVLELGAAPGATWRDAVAECARAVQLRRVSVTQLRTALNERSRHPHRRVLEVALGALDEGAESLLEVWYLERVQRRHGLPPVVMQRVEGDASGVVRRDFLYEAYGVVVEVDGRLGHEGTGMWTDRRRDRSAARIGLLTLRAGFVDLAAAPCELTADVVATLESRGFQGSVTACGPRCALRRPR